MRRLIVAAATAAALGTLGLTATAQAQPATLRALTITGPASAGVVAGIPAGFQETATPNTSACTWSITPALPKTVTLGKGGTNGCSVVIDGVWTTPATITYKLKVTAGGASVTKSVKATIANSPAEADATGVGSDTIQNVLDQFSVDWNSSHTASTATHLFSWDATNPLTGAIGDSIAEKTGCPHIPRPDGSSAGITQLATFQKTSDGKAFCSSFARSSRARASTDPAFAPGGIAFVDLAGDAVTWSAQATTNAPATLTTAQLAAIYNCTDTNWSQVGGKNAPIHAFIPQSGSGTRAFFLSAIGIATPGSCVSDDNGQLEENEGVNPVLNDPDAIFPYSTGKYIAEKFHSATCFNTSCNPNGSGLRCTPSGTQDLFGCNNHGTMVLKQINGIAPTTGTGQGTVINSAFPATFQRTVFEVVPYDPNTSDHIPGATNPVGGVNLEQIFGASGFVCTNATAKADLKKYGFLVTPLCGVTG
jgi:ABC-type phosphate transport system substrate-binding protein